MHKTKPDVWQYLRQTQAFLSALVLVIKSISKIPYRPTQQYQSSRSSFNLCRRNFILKLLWHEVGNNVWIPSNFIAMMVLSLQCTKKELYKEPTSIAWSAWAYMYGIWMICFQVHIHVWPSLLNHQMLTQQNTSKGSSHLFNHFVRFPTSSLGRLTFTRQRWHLLEWQGC